MGVNGSEEKEFSFRNVLFLIKKYIVLILAVVIVSGCIGFAYTKTKTPVYTASETVSYVAKITPSGDALNTNDINVMSAYFDTVVDFCVTGSVIDRANVYYNDYLLKDGSVTLDEYIEDKKSGSSDYTKNENLKYFTSGSVGSQLVGGKNDKFIFKLSVQMSAKNSPKEDGETLREMIRIYALACDVEARDAFGSVKTYIHEWVSDTDSIVVASNVSLVKNMAISVLLGLVVSFLAVLILYLLDNTITSTEELERITGANLLSNISDQEM